MEEIEAGDGGGLDQMEVKSVRCEEGDGWEIEIMTEMSITFIKLLQEDYFWEQTTK